MQICLTVIQLQILLGKIINRYKNATIRQHYVSKRYLKKWSKDGKRIYTRFNKKSKWKLLGLNDVCVINNFYRIDHVFNDFELILIDDGSPDNCGAICDDYSQIDARRHLSKYLKGFNKPDDKNMVKYDPSTQYAVIISSICTGEKVAGFKNKIDGHFTGVMLIKTPKDEKTFKEMYGLDDVPTEY